MEEAERTFTYFVDALAGQVRRRRSTVGIAVEVVVEVDGEGVDQGFGGKLASCMVEVCFSYSWCYKTGG